MRFEDATALRGGVSRSLLQTCVGFFSIAEGAADYVEMCSVRSANPLRRLRRKNKGGNFVSNERETPPLKAVASANCISTNIPVVA